MPRQNVTTSLTKEQPYSSGQWRTSLRANSDVCWNWINNVRSQIAALSFTDIFISGKNTAASAYNHFWHGSTEETVLVFRRKNSTKSIRGFPAPFV